MIEWELLIKGLVIGRFIVNFEPITWFFEGIPDLGKWNLFKYIPLLLLSCWKCATFWITLSLTGDLFQSSLNFIIATLITNGEQEIKDYIWLKKQQLQKK